MTTNKKVLERVANGFAAVYGESHAIQNQLLAVRATLLEQIKSIDDFISGIHRQTMNNPKPVDSLYWARTWYETIREEADNAPDEPDED